VENAAPCDRGGKCGSGVIWKAGSVAYIISKVLALGKFCKILSLFHCVIIALYWQNHTYCHIIITEKNEIIYDDDENDD